VQRQCSNANWLVIDAWQSAVCLRLVGNMSIGRREAYELFRRDYEHNDTIESNKHRLKQLCVEAKQFGEQLAESRKKISMLDILCRCRDDRCLIYILT